MDSLTNETTDTTSPIDWSALPPPNLPPRARCPYCGEPLVAGHACLTDQDIADAEAFAASDWRVRYRQLAALLPSDGTGDGGALDEWLAMTPAWQTFLAEVERRAVAEGISPDEAVRRMGEEGPERPGDPDSLAVPLAVAGLARVTVALYPEQVAYLDVAARQRGVSRSEVVRALLDQSLADFPGYCQRMARRPRAARRPNKGIRHAPTDVTASVTSVG